MKLYGQLLFTVVVSWHMLAVNSEETTESGIAHAAAASEAVNAFSKSLYKELSSMTGNLVVSPFSVEAVVAMLYLGLQGDTAKRVSTALHLPDDRSLVQQGFKSLFHSLQNSENVTLEIANKIYIERSFRIKEEFRQATQTYFQSVAEEADIANDSETVRIAVNDWAAEKTHDKIRDLLAPGTLTPDVVMILLNAIYFKGLWETPFDKDHTSDRLFYLSTGGSKSVPMMSLNTPLPHVYLYDENLKVLKLPYQGGKFSMLLFLPDDNNGLQQLESRIQHMNISQTMGSLREIEMTVMLPRFKILNTIHLETPLKQLGMEELFRPGANFSGITDEEVFISKALQKAFIEVNEEGTEAAAVTALFASTTSVGGPPHGIFIADHPFMYMIVEEQKGTILFMGRVMEPQE